MKTKDNSNDTQITKNLIDAMTAYGLEYNWCDSEIIDVLVGVGITHEDFCQAGMGDFVKNYFEDTPDREYAPWKEYGLSRTECDAHVTTMVSTIRGDGVTQGSGYYGLKAFTVDGENFNLYCEVSKILEDDSYFSIYYAVEYDEGDDIFSGWAHTEKLSIEELKDVVFKIASSDYTQTVLSHIAEGKTPLTEQIQSAASRTAQTNSTAHNKIKAPEIE